MADYKDFDEALDNSQVDFGVGTGKEPVRANLKSTNAASWRTVLALTDKDQADAKKLRAQIAQAIWEEASVEYENQVGADGKPLPVNSGKGARDTMARSFQATNGQVYRNASTLARIEAKIDALAEVVAKLAGSLGN